MIAFSDLHYNASVTICMRKDRSIGSEEYKSIADADESILLDGRHISNSIDGSISKSASHTVPNGTLAIKLYKFSTAAWINACDIIPISKFG